MAYCADACEGVSLANRFAYFSVGTGEKRTSSTTFRQAEENTRATVKIFETAGAQVAYKTSPGKHFDHVAERWQAGLLALDQWLVGA